MTRAADITRMPRPFDAERGAEARAAAPWAEGDVAALIEGAGGSSPFLKGLIEAEADWLETAMDDPDAALSALREALDEGAPDSVGSDLRRAKRRVALLSGLADLGGIWPLERVTGALTEFADLAVARALTAAIGTEIRRGKLPRQGEDDLALAGGMVVLAMGKMGAHELNYSSDIDLICLFDESRFDPDDYHEARASFVRATRRMAATLNDVTGEGYVFRTDLRLRPDPSVTPVCIAMEAAEHYYESLGRTWERAAYIKARPCAGDIAAGERFLQTLTPFIWRRHLDFAAIQDAHDMRLRIRAHKGLGGPITLEKHDMKLGRGGIREIEFFTQTRQIIAGGRDPDLRERGTVVGLRRLAEKNWVPDDVAETLARHYRAHREVEHRVQMVNDAQTHALPGEAEGFERLACLMGTESAVLRDDLRARLEEVHALTEGFFTQQGTAPDAQAPADAAGPLADSEIPARWPAYPALRSARAVEIFNRLKPQILARLSGAARPEEALIAFDGFLSGLPAGVQLFALFEANPQLIDLLVDIVGTSPDLGRYLAQNSGVFDAVIGGGFFAGWEGREVLTRDISDRLAQEDDYERKLDAARRWAKEAHFRIGVHLLRGLVDAREAAGRYSDLAEAVLVALWPHVVEEFAAKHGPPPGRGACLLGMGSLGAGRLHARSDLDVIVIYDPEDVESSEGRRPLSSRAYYARLTQALVTALTAQMAQGTLYEVDMRLRPSGNQGPVATSWSAFRDYQTTQAWTWEHLALTRARPIAGAEALAEDVEAFRMSLLAKQRDSAPVLADVAAMRARIAAAKGEGGPLEPKLGRGRLQDIELLAQTGALLSGEAPRGTAQGLEALVPAGVIDEAGAAVLTRTHELCWTLQMGLRLISRNTLAAEDLGAGGGAFLLRLTGEEDLESLTARLSEMAARAAEIIDEALPARDDAARETDNGKG